MQITRNNQTIYEGEFETALYIKNDLNQEYIDVSILSPFPIIFQKGDIFNYEGNDYFLDETSVTAVKNNSHNFSFSLKFYPSYYKALEVAFLYQNRSVFPIDTTLDNMITLLVENLNRVDSGWIKGEIPSTTILALDFSNSNCIEALAYISSVFDMQFSMENKVITLYKTPSNLPKKTLNYPKDFDRVERNIDGRQKIVNKVYATGSTENLPADYGYDTLRIDPLQDNNSISKYGLSEGFYSNPDIKPTTQARITSTTSEAWVIGTTDIGYDINNYTQNNAKPIINFETGQLAGLSFYIKNSVFTSGQSIITIERSNHGGVTVPNDNLKAVSGDLFNITNIQQPLEVVQQAEQKLREEALEFLNKRKENNAQVRIDLTPFGDYIPNFDEKIIINEPQFDIYSEYFVKSITKNINHPNNYMVELTYNRRVLNIKPLKLTRVDLNSDLQIIDVIDKTAFVKKEGDNFVTIKPFSISNGGSVGDLSINEGGLYSSYRDINSREATDLIVDKFNISHSFTEYTQDPIPSVMLYRSFTANSVNTAVEATARGELGKPIQTAIKAKAINDVAIALDVEGKIMVNGNLGYSGNIPNDKTLIVKNGLIVGFS